MKIWPVKYFKSPKGGGSAVVNQLFIVARIVCGGSMLGLCFVLQYLVSFLVLQSSSWEKESRLLYFCCFLNGIEAFSGHTHLLLDISA